MLAKAYRIPRVIQPLSEKIVLTNTDFLTAIFGQDAAWAHVTSFTDDPSNIPNDRRALCWGGDYFCRRALVPDSNQYYTISTFYADEEGKARRRKALFRQTHVIVADDVEEKLPLSSVQRLPLPSFKLETSPGSQQWGWILTEPATDRAQVENLLDGLVAKGLAPDGKDPGMKGVTRFVRLPEGVNTKASRIAANGGLAPRCRMLEWHPDRKVTLADLAAPFEVDLFAARQEGAIDGAADVPDHPYLEKFHIKSVLSDGRYDVTCPWVQEHTDAADDGAAAWTNADLSIGFKCHHGACQERTGGDVLKLFEQSAPGFTRMLDTWKVHKRFAEVAPQVPAVPQVPAASGLCFINPQQTAPAAQGAPAPAPALQANPDTRTGVAEMVYQLQGMAKRMPETYEFGYKILEMLDPLPFSDKKVWHDEIREHLDFNRKEWDKLLQDLQGQWYARDEDESFYQDYVYVAEQNAFFDRRKRMMLPPETFANLNGHRADNVRNEALLEGKCAKVDKIDYAPGMPSQFIERGVSYANAWVGDIEQGVPGEVSRWLDHFRVLGWQENLKHITQWMAFTLRHPEIKINHILGLCGKEGSGKDYLLYPLRMAMGQDAAGIDGEELFRDFNDYLLSCKYLHINEVESGDRKEAAVIVNKLKPLGSAPPDTLRINIKGVSPVRIRNTVNVSLTSNSVNPVKLDNGSRRYYLVWSDLRVLDEHNNMTPEWRAYWQDRWYWMKQCEGWKAVVHYLQTQVDLADFNPGSAPPSTEFVREIQQHNMDPVLASVLTYRQHRIGLFKSDLLTADDILNQLKAGQVGTNTHAALALIPPRQINNLMARNVSKILRQDGRLGEPLRARNSHGEHKVWVLRNRAEYERMTPSQLLVEYDRQRVESLSSNPMEVVNG